MPLCSFSDKYRTMGVTPVENVFIQTFLPQAPGDYVRVYLYGLMQCYYGVGETTLEQMATVLDLPLGKVVSAYQYWERQGLVERMKDNPPEYCYLHPVDAMMNGAGRLDEQIYRYQNLINRLQKMLPDRPFRPADSDIVCQWVEDLGMPEDVVVIFVQHCIDNYLFRPKGRRPESLKNFSLKNCDKEAVQWASEGILTVEKAELRVERDKRHYRLAARVLEQLSLQRAPTKDELALSIKWLNEWDLDEDAVIAACRETVKGRNPSFGYLDGILERNHEARSREDMERRMAEDKQLNEGVKKLYDALGLRGRAPTEEDLKHYRMQLAGGFSPEAVLLVAREMGSHGQYDMESLQNKLAEFAERGQFTESEVGGYIRHQGDLRRKAAKMLELCGIDRRVAAADVVQMQEWLGKYSPDLIAYAAICAHGTQLPLKYMNKTLDLWGKEGITDAEQARAQHPPRKASSNQTEPQPSFQQREYTNEQLAYLFEDDEEEGAK